MTIDKRRLKAVKKGIDEYGFLFIIFSSYKRTCEVLVQLYVCKYIDKDEYLELYDYIYDYYSIHDNIDVTPYILEYKGELIDRIP